MRAGPDALRRLLVGADRRSIARSNEALALLRADPTRIADLVGLVEDHDGLVALRAVDLLEKLAHEHPEWIQPHRMLFIGRLAQHPSWEIRLQIARALPLLRWTPAERARVVDVLLGYAAHPQTFVRAWSVDSLSRFAAEDASLMSVVEAMLADFERSASPALRSRARQIRTRQRAVDGEGALGSLKGRDAPAGLKAGRGRRAPCRAPAPRVRAPGHAPRRR